MRVSLAFFARDEAKELPQSRNACRVFKLEAAA